MNYPHNEEHFEAFSAEVNRMNQEAAAALSPEERIKLDAIEQAAKVLEDAKVPFVMWAAPDKDGSGFWRRNRLVYDDTLSFEERGAIATDRAVTHIGPNACKWFFPDAVWLAAYDANFKLVGAYGPPTDKLGEEASE